MLEILSMHIRVSTVTATATENYILYDNFRRKKSK
jgi:hypothetical protein